MQTRFSFYLTYFLAVAAVLFLRNGANCQKLRFEHININNGLSHNDVMQIMQDEKGYIWIATLDGLNKYDGYQFTHYQRKPFDSTSITSNVVTGIWRSSNTKLWVHPVASDLNLFDPETEVFSVSNPLPANNLHFKQEILRDMEEDREGMIWICNDQNQVCRFNKKTNRISGEDFGTVILNNPYDTSDHYRFIGDIFRDSQGVIWIGSSEGLHRVNTIPDKKGKPSHIYFTHYWRNKNDPLSVPAVGGIFEDHSGKFWLSGFEGLTCFDRQTRRIVKYRHQQDDRNSLGDDRISGLAEDAQGNLWISTHNGLNRLDKERQHFSRYYHNSTDPTSLSGNLIMTIFIDKSNTLWAATLQSGISKVSLNYYTFPLNQHNSFDENSLSNNKVTAICEDTAGIIWIGTLGGGLNAWNRATEKFVHYRHDPNDPASLFSDSIGSVFNDHNGNLWIGSGTNGNVVLSKMNQNERNFTHHSLVYPSIYNPFAGPIFTIYEDKAGLFWIGTVDGIVTFDPVTKKSQHYSYYEKNSEERVSDPWIFSFCEDQNGDMWIGTSTFELNKLNRRTGKFSKYTSGPKDSGRISSQTVRCLFKDSKGTLWFGTFGGGLCRLNPGNETFTAFTMKEGLPSNSIHSIEEDDEGNLWLGTGNGLSKFSVSTGAITNYDIKDGLQSNQFTVGHSTAGASFKGRDGTLYFGGVNGFNAFHPKFLQPNQHIPPVVINHFKLFDKVLPGKHASKEIKLDYDQNFFSFEYAALDYTNSRKNQYAYKLEGFDKDWVYSGTRRLASYTGVAPGEYTFRVRGSNNDGVWNNEGTFITVIISPPWWRTNLAYAFYVLCFIVLVYSIHRFQHQRIVRKERERSRELQLQQAKQIEEAYHQLKTTQAQLIQSEKMASLGELTAGIAHEIQNPLNFVNNFSEINKELIQEFKAEWKNVNENSNKEIEQEILNDIEQNLDKVLHHGKRADAIVKGMLQHSRNNKGSKEPTNINALADEYLRLAYHGFRAKNKEFNVDITTEFDETVGNLNIIPQDIGRVLLNIYNNAFYAVKPSGLVNGTMPSPSVKVSTKKTGETVEIRIADNGAGIPERIVDKIFQPFFTTKPTGQGTGLGLSLSYDIIKAHGGEIKVETDEGHGSQFIILFRQDRS